MLKSPRGPTPTKIVEGERPGMFQEYRHLLKMLSSCRICEGPEWYLSGPVVSETKRNPDGRDM